MNNVYFMKLVGASLVVFGVVAILGMVVVAVLKYPVNHGMNPFIFGVPFCTILVIAFCLRAFGQRPSLRVFVIAIFGLLLVVISDRFNVFLSYDRWTSRGMPDWGKWHNSQEFKRAP